MVNQPGEYRWSSYHANAYNQYNALVTPHQLYTALSTDDEKRLHAYSEIFTVDMEQSELNQIRQAAAFSMPPGSTRFKEQIQHAPGRKSG